MTVNDVSQYLLCNCGAVTMYLKSGQEIHCKVSRMPKYLGFSFEELQDTVPIDARIQAFQCNHCINHWGIDLCGCGSGVEVGHCKGEYDECKNNIPMELIPDNI